VARNVLGTREIRVVLTDRGGDVTYHGPGQLVAYPIVKLGESKAVRAYVHALEEACVRTAASFGVRAAADPRRPGVWVGDAKLAAVGVRITDRVTRHGLAFNVAPELDDFAGLVPCGIADGGVCSLRSLGVDASVEEVRRRLTAHLGDTLARTLQPASPANLGLVVAAA
jgi:lipoyl(octanoyl) transferase